ncbi:MAG TPA: GNAT family N-acetyltransferase [Ktedonobacterales bacterium]|jgi:GNAT superfamily N-acetyltransferase
MAQNQAQQDPIHILQATLADLDALLPLFLGYRLFYKHQPEEARAREYLRERIERQESVIFLAWQPRPCFEGQAGPTTQAVGFTQLFPLFSSDAMKRFWLLNDLFVAPEARHKGVGKLLLERARSFAEGTQAAGLMLQTAIDNFPAQALYESLGWKRDEHFYVYELWL